MTDDNPSTDVTLNLPTDLIERFEKIAAAMNRPRSWVMLRALREYFEAEGAEMEEDIESLAQADRGELEPFENSLEEIRQIIQRAEQKRQSRK